MSFPAISILIPTLNAGPLFADVLSRLRSQAYSSTPELLIIDSGSTDQTLDIARAHNATIHQIPKKDFDHGLTRNMGIERSTGDIVILMTQDALPNDNLLLQNLAAAFDDPQVAGAFARQFPRPDADAIVARNINNWVAGSDQPRTSHITDRKRYDSLHPIEKYLFCVFDNVTSAVRRSAWQQIPFHQNAFGEDIEWAKRALEAGWKIAYTPAAAVVHSHDRPIQYEYRRNYMCHQTLYRLFRVQTLPARRHLPRAIFLGTLKDTLYALRHQKSLSKKTHPRRQNPPPHVLRLPRPIPRRPRRPPQPGHPPHRRVTRVPQQVTPASARIGRSRLWMPLRHQPIAHPHPTGFEF